MKSYSINVGSRLRRYDQAGNLTQNSNPTGYTDSLSAPLSNKGNMKLPTNFNYSIIRQLMVHGNNMQTYTPTGVVVMKANGNFANAPVVPVREQKTHVYNMALERLNSRVRGNLDLSVALAEANTTARMFKNVAKVLSHARRLKPPSGYGGPRDVANGYLQWKYGWQPLLSDVFGVANESLRIVINRLEKIQASARIPEDGISRVIYPVVDSVSNVPFKRTRLKGSFSGCKIGIILEIPNTAFQLDRWTSVNPLSIAWEVLPYSFVVDWFVDVGSYLRNVETACLYNLQFRSGYVSEIWRQDIMDECVIHAHVQNPYQFILSGLNAEYQCIDFRRTVLSSYPFPRRPTVKVDLSSGQLFSAAALLTQLMPGGRKLSPPNPSTKPGGGATTGK